MPGSFKTYWLVLLVTAALTGCTPIAPYRDVTNPKPPLTDCSPSITGDTSKLGTVDTQCARLVKETSSSHSQEGDEYILYFVEFDDQGWQHNPVHANFVIDEIRSHIKETIKTGNSQLSIITFAHGLHHNAHTADSNVRQFRLLLRSIALRERLKIVLTEGSRPQKTIIGIYIGWRGASVTAPGIKDLSFWDRKKAAAQVAQGSVREFLARVDTLADIANQPWYENELTRAKSIGTSDYSPKPKPVRTLFIGHSFGGHIMFTAFSAGVLRDIVELQEIVENCKQQHSVNNENCNNLPLRRQGDMLLLLNPAIEGTRYEPLHVAANHPEAYPRYIAPVFVAVTSDADTALSRWFPLGRAFSTMFEAYPDDAQRAALQREANKEALGGINRYLTHSLCSRDSTLPNCKRISPDPDLPCPGWDTEIETDRLGIEAEMGPALREAWQKKVDKSASGENNARFSDISRYFCGDIRLVAHENTPRYSPIWNIRTDKRLIGAHNRIVGDGLISVIRQIYGDTADSTTLNRTEEK